MYLILSEFFLLSFFSTLVFIPSILKIGKKYKVYDQSMSSSNDSNKAILLGGIAIVFGFSCSFKLLSFRTFVIPDYFSALNSALVIIFIHGIADDLLIFKPVTKLLSQIVVSFILIFICKIQFDFTLPFNNIIPASYVTILISFLFVIVTINSFNLIDGIDGLASGISLISLITYGVLFFLNMNYFYSSMAFALSGSILAFLIFNRSPAKMYMGDAGSLFIGMVLAIFTFVYVNANHPASRVLPLNKLIVGISILMLPIMDLIRLFFVRIYNNKNPFKGDKMHIHHLLSELGFTHNQISLWLCILHLAIISTSFILFSSTIAFFVFTFIIYIVVVQSIRQLITLKNKMRFLLNENNNIKAPLVFEKPNHFKSYLLKKIV